MTPERAHVVATQIAWQVEAVLRARTLGGAGSGNFGHAGRKGEVGGSGEGASRSERALAAHNPFTKEKEILATRNEQQVAMMVGGTSTDDNLPVDIVLKREGRTHGIEVKTMLDNKSGQVTMRKDALFRKKAWARSNHASLHTVVIDDRHAFNRQDIYSGHRIYYQKGTASFRLRNMVPVRDVSHLNDLLQGRKT